VDVAKSQLDEVQRHESVCALCNKIPEELDGGDYVVREHEETFASSPLDPEGIPTGESLQKRMVLRALAGIDRLR